MRHFFLLLPFINPTSFHYLVSPSDETMQMKNSPFEQHITYQKPGVDMSSNAKKRIDEDDILDEYPESSEESCY